ncbi:hypothetical protein JCM6882_005365 [Rhodosporidiobolus microsporus]
MDSPDPADDSDTSSLSSLSSVEHRWALPRSPRRSTRVPPSPTRPPTPSAQQQRHMRAERRASGALLSKRKPKDKERVSKDALAGGLAALLSSTPSLSSRQPDQLPSASLSAPVPSTDALRGKERRKQQKAAKKAQARRVRAGEEEGEDEAVASVEAGPAPLPAQGGEPPRRRAAAEKARGALREDDTDEEMDDEMEEEEQEEESRPPSPPPQQPKKGKSKKRKVRAAAEEEEGAGGADGGEEEKAAKKKKKKRAKRDHLPSLAAINPSEFPAPEPSDPSALPPALAPLTPSFPLTKTGPRAEGSKRAAAEKARAGLREMESESEAGEHEGEEEHRSAADDEGEEKRTAKKEGKKKKRAKRDLAPATAEGSATAAPPDPDLSPLALPPTAASSSAAQPPALAASLFPLRLPTTTTMPGLTAEQVRRRERYAREKEQEREKRAREREKRERQRERERERTKRQKEEREAAKQAAASRVEEGQRDAAERASASAAAASETVTHRSLPANYQLVALPSHLQAPSPAVAAAGAKTSAVHWAVQRSLELDARGGSDAALLPPASRKRQLPKRFVDEQDEAHLSAAATAAAAASGEPKAKKAKKTTAPATAAAPLPPSAVHKLLNPAAAPFVPSRPLGGASNTLTIRSVAVAAAAAVPITYTDPSFSHPNGTGTGSGSGSGFLSYRPLAPRPALPASASTAADSSALALGVHPSLLPHNLPPVPFGLPPLLPKPGSPSTSTSFSFSPFAAPHPPSTASLGPLPPGFKRPSDPSAPSTSSTLTPKPRGRPRKPPLALGSTSASSSSDGKALHPSLLSRAGWVPCAKDLRLEGGGRPPIWCEGRQELCESLEYFKSYQGGHYDLQERCLGYLLDGFPSANDRCEDQGRIIISHGGGCSEATPLSSTSAFLDPSNPSSRPLYRLKADQLRTNTRMRALQNCLDRKTPVVLIAGRLWEFFPQLGGLGAPAGAGAGAQAGGDSDGEGEDEGEGKKPRKGKGKRSKRDKEREEGLTRYAVLGHYWVTDIWAEGEPAAGGKNGKGKGKAGEGEADGEEEEEEAEFYVRFKVRFEWVAAQGKPWFADVIGPEGSLSPEPSPDPSPAAAATKPSSSTSSSSPSLTASPLLDKDADSPMTIATSLPDDAGADEATEGKKQHDDEKVTCKTCKQTHRRVYQEDIECYNEKCDRFFLLDGSMPSPASLTYCSTLTSPSLALLTSPDHTTPLVPESLFPTSLQSLAGTSRISDYSFLAWRGFHCSACGRLSSRSDWDRLRCAGCGVEVQARGRVFRAEELAGVWEGKKGRRTSGRGVKPKDRLAGAHEAGGGGAVPSTSFGFIPPPVVPSHPLSNDRRLLAPLNADPSFIITTLRIPGIEGYSVYLLPPSSSSAPASHPDVEGAPPAPAPRATVHHLWPSTAEGYRDADELFEAYQGAEAGELFVRNRLSTHKAAGSLLCQQFTFNAGERYKHAIKAQTYPFAPDPSASSSSAAPSAPTSTYAPTCAKRARDYLQKTVQRVVGHGEETEFNEILSVAYMTGGKMNYHDDGERGLGPFVASISLGTDAIMSFRAKTKKCKPGKKSKVEEEQAQAEEEEVKKGKAAACLRVRLKHGDVLIMEGEDMQKLFEHAVTPEGLRFAATARFVGPDHLNPPPAYKTTAYGSGFAAHQKPPSRFAYQDAPAPPVALPSADQLPPLPQPQYPMRHVYHVPKPGVVEKRAEDQQQQHPPARVYHSPSAAAAAATTSTGPSQFANSAPTPSHPSFPLSLPTRLSDPSSHRPHPEPLAPSAALNSAASSPPCPRGRVVPPPPPPYQPGVVYPSASLLPTHPDLKQRAATPIEVHDPEPTRPAASFASYGQYQAVQQHQQQHTTPAASSSSSWFLGGFTRTFAGALGW